MVNHRGFIFEKPKKVRKPRRKNFVAFDVETRKDGSFICGAYYGFTTTRRGLKIPIEEYYENVEEFQKGLLKIEETFKTNRQALTLVGFNTSFDIVYLGDLVNSLSRLDAGSRFIQVQTVNGTKILDVANHVIGKLEDWIKRLNMEEKYDIRKREGYLDSEEGKKAQVLDDAKATYYLADWVQDQLITRFNTPFKPTRFGVALEIFRRNYFTGRWRRKSSEQWKNDFEREGYYGGRTEVFRRGKYKVNSYDVNSMYVTIMRDELIPNPTISKYLKDERKILSLLQDNEHLMIDCDVFVPEGFIGLLPFREPKDNLLIFPTGTWRGVYTAIELRAAMRYGAQIRRVHRALHYPESDRYFREYAQMTLEGRAEAKRNGDKAMNELYKYYGNGLYGKFGQRNTIGGQYVRLSQIKDKSEILGKTVEPGAGDIKDLCSLPDALGVYWLEIPVMGYKDSWHTFPIISATITGYARAKMLDALKANETSIVYCDTDSIKVIDNVHGITISEEPGDWSDEYKTPKEEEFYGPKLYGDKRKGVPKKARLISKTDDTETYEFERPITFKESFRRRIRQNTWETATKTVKLIDKKRQWLPDGTSIPLKVVAGEVINSLSLPQSHSYPAIVVYGSV